MTGGNNVVRGLVIHSYSYNQITMFTNGGNTVEGNYLGLDRTGTTMQGSSQRGLRLSGIPDNVVGGTKPWQRNVMAGTSQALQVDGSGATNNVIQGNYLGTNASGTQTLGNMGVFIYQAPGNNVVGGTAPGAGNLVSGNEAIYINDTTAGNLVQGNLIGTDPTGTALINGAPGVGVLIIMSPGNTIGGTAAGAAAPLVGVRERRACRVISHLP